MIQARHLKPDARVILPPTPPRRGPVTLSRLLAAVDASPFRQNAIEQRAGFPSGTISKWRPGDREPRQINIETMWQALHELENSV